MKPVVTVALLLCVAAAAHGEVRAKRGLKIYDLIRGKGDDSEPAPAMEEKPPKPQDTGFDGFHLEDALAPANNGNNNNNNNKNNINDNNAVDIAEVLMRIERRLDALLHIEELQMKILNAMANKRRQ